MRTNESRSKERGIVFEFAFDCKNNNKHTDDMNIIMILLVKNFRHCLSTGFVYTINLVPERF